MALAKQSFSKFRQWQKDSTLHIPQPSDERHHCHCCESDYTGNYCPQCGQKAGDQHITWASIRTGVMDLWGMGTRSLPYTLWQLLLRPGYLIGDYISGRRQVSFPPIKMLVFVALLVYIVISVLYPEDTNKNPESNYMMLDYAFDFFEKHYDVGMMFFFSLFIIPTYFIFRFAPRCDHHTLPEGFYIQVFNSTLALLLILVFSFFEHWDLNDTFLFLLLVLIAVFVVYRSYYQLFGYSHWSTLWRVISVCVSAALTLAALVLSDFVTTLLRTGDSHRALVIFCIRFIPFVLGAVLVIGVSYFISRRTAKTH